MNNLPDSLTLRPPAAQAEFGEDRRVTLARMIAERALRLLSNLVSLQPDRVAIYALPRNERVILAFDLEALPGLSMLPKFLRSLPQALNGRRIAVYEKGGLFIQVGYWPEPAMRLEAQGLDLTRQPSPLHVPVGMTRSGALWLSILEMDSVLVGGARRLGKTTLLHGWIQALLQGKQAMLVLWDGKNGTEFGRYAGPNALVVSDLPAALAQVQQEVTQREALFRQRGVTSLPQYNALAGVAPILPIVLALDELADLPAQAEGALIELVRRAGAYGVHPVVGIQRPDAEVMKGQLKANLTIRFALPVASLEDSRIILGRPGAEKLPKVKGRLLFVWNARLVEAQAFRVTLPQAHSSAIAQPLGLLSEREQRLVLAAQQTGGWFRVREVTDLAGESRDWVNQVAQRWEMIGYLTPVQTEPGSGRRLGRKLTPAVLQAAGSGGLADLADQASETRI
jgi:hypothetical protein